MAELPPLPGESLQGRKYIAVQDLSPLQQMCMLSIFPDEPGRRLIDEYTAGCPAAQRLKAQRSCTGKDIQDLLIADTIAKYIEQRLLYTVSRWPGQLPLRGFQPAAAGGSRYNSHNFTPEKFLYYLYTI